MTTFNSLFNYSVDSLQSLATGKTDISPAKDIMIDERLLNQAIDVYQET